MPPKESKDVKIYALTDDAGKACVFALAGGIMVELDEFDSVEKAKAEYSGCLCAKLEDFGGYPPDPLFMEKKTEELKKAELENRMRLAAAKKRAEEMVFSNCAENAVAVTLDANGKFVSVWGSVPVWSKPESMFVPDHRIDHSQHVLATYRDLATPDTIGHLVYVLFGDEAPKDRIMVRQAISKFDPENPGAYRIPFGKYKGSPVMGVPVGYLNWMISEVRGESTEMRNAVEAARLYLSKKGA